MEHTFGEGGEISAAHGARHGPACGRVGVFTSRLNTVTRHMRHWLRLWFNGIDFDTVLYNDQCTYLFTVADPPHPPRRTPASAPCAYRLIRFTQLQYGPRAACAYSGIWSRTESVTSQKNRRVCAKDTL